MSDSDQNEKRRAANESNSQHSTGPRTEEGKRVSSQNALKFGFFSAKALLPGEVWEDFMDFHEDLLHQFSPHTRFEKHLVEQYAALAWRLKRLPEIEAGVFNRYGISVQGNQCGSAFAMVANLQTDNVLGQLARYEATLRKSCFKYLDLLRALRKDGAGGGAVPIIDAQVIEKVASAQTANDAEDDPEIGGSAE